VACLSAAKFRLVVGEAVGSAALMGAAGPIANQPKSKRVAVVLTRISMGVGLFIFLAWHWLTIHVPKDLFFSSYGMFVKIFWWLKYSIGRLSVFVGMLG
jgi:hypothetical protein